MRHGGGVLSRIMKSEKVLDAYHRAICHIPVGCRGFEGIAFSGGSCELMMGVVRDLQTS